MWEHLYCTTSWPEPHTGLAPIKRRGSRSLSRDLQGAHAQVHQLPACCRDGASNCLAPRALPGPGGSRPPGYPAGTIRGGMHRVGWAGGCGCRLCCATSAEFFPLQCKLTGQWQNDFGSNMTIYEVNENGGFTGKYLTAVSDSPEEIKESPLVGSQQLPYWTQPTFGFTVHWTFSGIYPFLSILAVFPDLPSALPAVSLLIPCLPLHYAHCSPSLQLPHPCPWSSSVAASSQCQAAGGAAGAGACTACPCPCDTPAL